MEAKNEFSIVGQDEQSTTVPCWNCQSTYDYLDAAWCFCVTANQTIICPHCLTCVCGATAKVQQQFWASAPQALWRKRIERNRTDHKRAVAQTEVPAVPEGKPVVLIADDSRLIRMILRQVAVNAGYTVVEAADGAEALRLAQSIRPRVLIADALMPKLDGREMARMLKSDPATADIKVIIVSGLYTARRYSAEALTQFGVDEYLTKPLNPGRLETLLAKFTFAAMPPGMTIETARAQVA